jgi:hypothetical protein
VAEQLLAHVVDDAFADRLAEVRRGHAEDRHADDRGAGRHDGRNDVAERRVATGQAIDEHLQRDDRDQREPGLEHRADDGERGLPPVRTQVAEDASGEVPAQGGALTSGVARQVGQRR